MLRLQIINSLHLLAVHGKSALSQSPLPVAAGWLPIIYTRVARAANNSIQPTAFGGGMMGALAAVDSEPKFQTIKSADSAIGRVFVGSDPHLRCWRVKCRVFCFRPTLAYQAKVHNFSFGAASVSSLTVWPLRRLINIGAMQRQNWFGALYLQLQHVKFKTARELPRFKFTANQALRKTQYLWLRV